MLKIFVPKERYPGETRLAATPETVKRMIKEDLQVLVQSGAGDGSHISDEELREAGAEIVSDATSAWKEADVVLKVREPAAEEATALKEGALLMALLAPHKNLPLVRQLADGKVTSVALELIPRITRAQSMDVLSSQASIAGYKAVLLAGARLGKYFPLLMTAAGTVPPARVVVMGAGVAGLQALATAKRLGAVVEVSDIREVVKEQVESLGGRFIELPMEESGEGAGGYAREMGEDFLRRQREIVTRHLGEADVAITTALVPGKPAPKLLTKEMVEAMRPGSVIIDLAVEQGGNCELSKADEEVVHKGVLILGPSNLAATMAEDASLLLSRNVLTLLKEFVTEGSLNVDLENEVIAGALLTHGGEVHHEPTAQLLAGANS